MTESEYANKTVSTGGSPSVSNISTAPAFLPNTGKYKNVEHPAQIFTLKWLCTVNEMRIRTLRRMITSTAIFLVIVCGANQAAFSQSQSTPGSGVGVGAAAAPRFDILSVRETHIPIIHESFPADGYMGQGVYLSLLIVEAYKIPVFDRIIGLPAWYSNKRFDITAKVDPAEVPTLQKLSYPERRTMLRQILAERFQLKMHEEEQTRPIYVLTSAGKAGPLLRRSPTPDPTSGIPPVSYPTVHGSRRGQLKVENASMTKVAELLSSSLHLDVVDQTHLDGLYDLELDWNPDETASPASDTAADKPSIFTAVSEQLGLKLSSSKGPVKVWVVDHVELPSEN
jgi:uncharacterized protein (TIGR03435 family)